VAERSENFRLRVGREELAGWKAAASRSNITVSAWVRRCCREALEMEAACARRDLEAEARVRRLGQLTPPEVDALRRRGGDWGDWKELDDEGA
jgi:hypothetical protein